MNDDSGSIFGTLLTSSAIIAVGLGFRLALGFLGRLVVARFLGRVNYGAVSLGLTLLMTASILVVLGTDNGVGRYLPRFDEPARRRGVLRSAFGIVVPLGIVLGVVVAVLAEPIATYGFTDPDVAPVVAVFGLAIPLAAVVRLTVGTIRGQQQALPRVAIDNVALPLSRFLLIAAAVFLGFEAVGVAWAYALAYAIAAALSLYYLVRGTPLFSRGESVPMRRELLVFSAPLMVTATMNMVLSNLDTLMLGYFASTGEVGVYNVAYPLANLLTVGLTAVGFLFMPIVSELHAEGRTDEIARAYHVASKWIALAMLPAFLVLVTFPGVVIGLTFGSEYVAGRLALAVLTVGFFVHAVAGPAGNALVAFGQTRRLMYYNVATAVINATLNLYLIPRYSYLGAAVATTISFVLLNAMFVVRLHLEIGTHPLRPAVLRPVLAAGVVWAGLAFWLSGLGLGGFPSLLATVVLFVPLYAVAVLRFGGVEEEEVELLESVEERFDVDLGRLRSLARRFAG